MPSLNGKPVQVANKSQSATQQDATQTRSQLPSPKMIDPPKESNIFPRVKPLWEGPSGEGVNGGITFSLLSRFIVCRERFKVKVIEGLGPIDGFNHRIEYGNMWHLCEEELATFGEPKWTSPTSKDAFFSRLTTYTESLCKRYRLSQDDIVHWMKVCKLQFEEYSLHWAKNSSLFSSNINHHLMAEDVFDFGYRLPSGRLVRLRGKRDGVFLSEDDDGLNLFIQENKTKSELDQLTIQRQLRFDMQTMIYLIVMHYDPSTKRVISELIANHSCESVRKRAINPSLSVLYNGVRRPLSGGKHSIRQHKGETYSAFLLRLKGLIQEDPGYFFMRWIIGVSLQDLARFKLLCLDPILEELCDWWEMMIGMKKEYPARHWIHPYGIYNPMDDGGFSEVDEYIMTGSTSGLTRITNLFPELTPIEM